MLLIIGVILAAGCLGGTVNHLLTRNTDPDALKFWPSVIVGIGAAFLVPLFLNMASSNLVEQIRAAQGPADFSKLLVFGGFCLAAAISSRAFIKTMSERVLREAAEAKKKASAAEEKAESAEQRAIGAEQSANQLKSEVEPIVANQTEQDTVSEPLSLGEEPRVLLNESERKVLEALANGRFTLRTRTGLARDSSLPKQVVNDLVLELKEKGLVSSTNVLKSDGSVRPRWYITPEGRAVVSELST